MARFMVAFHALRNMILHGARQENHIVTYQVDTDDPDIITKVSSVFLSDPDPKPKWDPTKCKNERELKGNGDAN
jgi:hypothetical protein